MSSTSPIERHNSYIRRRPPTLVAFTRSDISTFASPPRMTWPRSAFDFVCRRPIRRWRRRSCSRTFAFTSKRPPSVRSLVVQKHVRRLESGVSKDFSFSAVAGSLVQGLARPVRKLERSVRRADSASRDRLPIEGRCRTRAVGRCAPRARDAPPRGPRCSPTVNQRPALCPALGEHRPWCPSDRPRSGLGDPVTALSRTPLAGRQQRAEPPHARPLAPPRPQHAPARGSSPRGGLVREVSRRWLPKPCVNANFSATAGESRRACRIPSAGRPGEASRYGDRVVGCPRPVASARPGRAGEQIRRRPDESSHSSGDVTPEPCSLTGSRPARHAGASAWRCRETNLAASA